MPKKQLKAQPKNVPKLPSLDSLFFVILFSIAMAFGALLYGVGENIKQENFFIANHSQTISKFERKVGKLIGDKPMEAMVPFIAKQDPAVAAFIVAIAKKESNWGKFSPKKDGKECYNYWGYRGTYNQTASGYSCFDSPKQAVEVVGKRIANLVEQDIDTPQKMAVWKCGDCSGPAAQGVGKWITDVGMYYQKVYR